MPQTPASKMHLYILTPFQKILVTIAVDEQWTISITRVFMLFTCHVRVL